MLALKVTKSTGGAKAEKSVYSQGKSNKNSALDQVAHQAKLSGQNKQKESQAVQSTQGAEHLGIANKSVSPVYTHQSEALREMTNAVADVVEETDTFDMGFITFFPKNGKPADAEGKKVNAWIATE